MKSKYKIFLETTQQFKFQDIKDDAPPMLKHWVKLANDETLDMSHRELAAESAVKIMVRGLDNMGDNKRFLELTKELKSLTNIEDSLIDYQMKDLNNKIEAQKMGVRVRRPLRRQGLSFHLQSVERLEDHSRLTTQRHLIDANLMYCEDLNNQYSTSLWRKFLNWWKIPRVKLTPEICAALGHGVVNLGSEDITKVHDQMYELGYIRTSRGFEQEKRVRKSSDRFYR